jgi:hypothetical protein
MLSQMKRVFSGSGTSFNVSVINIKIARLGKPEKGGIYMPCCV